MINKTINGYTIKRLLGEGGMAEVWYAENGIGKPAAVKFLKKKFCEDENVTARFENEARVMVKLDHPNIRQVYDYTQVDGRPCIIMEYLDGADLKARIRTQGRVDSETAARYWDAIVSALNYTHRQDVIHRDIKPSNIFITSRGQIKLLDFGIAKVRDAVTGTQTGQKLGTLVYMSPEQITDSKHVDIRTDIYSLAVTFVHLLSGRIPYDTDTSSEYAIMDKIVKQPLDMTGVPMEWQNFLQPYLAKNPVDRPELIPFSSRTKADMVVGVDDMTLVENATSRETPKLKPETSGMASPRYPRKADPQKPASNSRKRLPWIIGGAAAAVLLLLILLLAGRNHDRAISPDENPALLTEQPDTTRQLTPVKNLLCDTSITIKDVTFKMVAVEGGTFRMGSNDGNPDEKPVHGVTLDDYYIGETEVTQALWTAVMGNNPTRLWQGKNYPVTDVSWNDARRFTEKLNSLTGKHFRLPTEAEWEYAARGGKQSKGFKYCGSDTISKVAWYNKNSTLARGRQVDYDGETFPQPVKLKQPNELGLFDMSGNIREWCSDRYGKYVDSSQVNPQGPDKGWARVCRGGGFNHEPRSCRVSSRYSFSEGSKEITLGFRLVMEP